MLSKLKRILFALSLAIAFPALAQSDPPARVGRLAHIEHQVDFRVDRNEQAGPATLNWPVSSGAVLETGGHGRAEVWIGSTAYRLADDSQLEFSVVDDERVDIRLNGGSLTVSILDRDQADDVMIATPDGNVRFLTPGRYRINVLGDRSELSVQAGRATLDDGQRVMPVAAGQRASSWSDGNVQTDAGPAFDTFDHWVANRENATLASQSRRLVSPRMTGYQDLDNYGDWQTAPDYGSVWYPRAVADDWAPYRYGRWAWVAPWGWTWIDQAPWGFAPFHYGRWAIINGRWGWVPGRLVARPVYAPALVAWIGNPGWNVGFRSGAAPAVGWFPLAPREVYVPGHRHSTKYVHQINVTHIRDVSVVDRAIRGGPRAPFVHHDLPRAVTVVPANMVREGQTITAREVRRQERPDLGRAPLARHAPNADWLAPAQGAARSHSDPRRDAISRPREFEAGRPNVQERSAPRFEAMPGRDGAYRPDAERRVRTPDAVPAPMRRDMPGPDMRLEERQAQPLMPSQEREQRREMQRMDRPVPPPREREAPQIIRQPEMPMPRAVPAPEVRMPAPPPVRDMPAPDMRLEERQARPPMPPQDREQRREMREAREMQRMDRPAPSPREREMPQIVRQPEMPRPVPEVRMPAPPPVREMPPVRVEPPRPVMQAPAPAPVPMPQQRVEPPRQAAPQGGGQPEQRRQRGRDEERGGR